MMLRVLLLVAVATVVTHGLSFEQRPPSPTRDCQKWCPRPGHYGQYDCCDIQTEVCEDNWPGICVDGLQDFGNGTVIKVGGCSCNGIKNTGWCDHQDYGQRLCRKTCGHCGDKPTPGKCPDTSGIITHCAITHENCFSDAECSQGRRCCSYGCGRRCLPVV
ncbi:unnamed protein product [Meganyctiphanes norvegica]|uniref:WAP domain-containing protein n=1 Tax=Meganyctiphanes norvegica TaxID=48144 RepID=A0AAV2RK20_MEGNR